MPVPNICDELKLAATCIMSCNTLDMKIWMSSENGLLISCISVSRVKEEQLHFQFSKMLNLNSPACVIQSGCYSDILMR